MNAKLKLVLVATAAALAGVVGSKLLMTDAPAAAGDPPVASVTAEAQPGTAPPRSSAPNATPAPPSAEQILRAIGPAEQDHQIVVWQQLTTEVDGQPTSLALVLLFPCAKGREWRGCQGTLKIGTFLPRGGAWELSLAQTVQSRASYGSFGAPHQGSAARVLSSFPGALALAIQDGSGRGDSEWQTILVREPGGWRDLGTIPVAENSSQDPECKTENCWEWKGTTQVLPSKRNGYPEIRLLAAGTVRGPSGTVRPKAAVTDYSVDATLGEYVHSGREAEVVAQRAREDADYQAAVAPTWYSADLNSSTCVKGLTPAARIRQIQDAGLRPLVVESGGLVIVGTDAGKNTFYRSRQECVAALPRSQAIPRRFE